MAGDWIKMRSDIFTHPKVVRISSALKADTLRTVGGLMSVWCLFDAHSTDGRLDGYTPDVLDDHLRWPGFSRAMVQVGWLETDGDDALVLPRFDTHNGQSAKRRAQDADRKREVRKTSASDADKKRTREEKRREEKKEISPEVVPTSEPVSGFTVPLSDGSDFNVPQRMLDDWTTLFPAVDVQQELREMRAWSLANKAKRKTRRGVEAFIVRWLSKAQDTPGRPRAIAAVDEQRSSMFAGCI